MQKILHVSDNPEHFSSIGSALAQIPANNTTPVIIEIAPGIYHEKLTINKPYITLRGMGESSAHTVISYDDYALDLMEDGSKRGTFRTYTLFIDTHDVTLQHLTIENASGDSATHGQAIALYADGDRLMIDSCRLLGHQDTLFTGPLPEKERQPGGFIGPKQFAPRINGRQYYKNCYICGDIDFIFGSATAYFEHCTLESLLRTKTSAQSDLVSTTSTLQNIRLVVHSDFEQNQPGQKADGSQRWQGNLRIRHNILCHVYFRGSSHENRRDGYAHQVHRKSGSFLHSRAMVCQDRRNRQDSLWR